MRQLTRYVIAEFLKVFLMTLAGMTLFMIAVLIAREALRQGLGLGPLLRLIPYGVPEALLYAVPATTLLAVCTIFGRMSSDNELVAIKSAGISPMVLVFPALALSFLVSLVAVWLNDLAVSWGEPGIKRVIVESIEQIAYRMLRARRSYGHDRFSIHVVGVEGQKLIRPTLVFYGPDGSPETTLTARQAQLKRNSQNNSLSILLSACTVEQGPYELADDDQLELSVPLLEANESDQLPSSPSHLPLREIPEQIDAQRAKFKQRQRELAALAAYQLLTGELDQLTAKHWQVYHDRLTKDLQRLKHLAAVPWRRWANGFSCLFFAMVGVPLAIRMRNANLFTTFAACFLPILIVYYPLLAYGVDRAKCGALPPYAVWLGNALCCVVGLILLRRVRRC
jgi:lipopolysaccharide export system permease protein